ncbi:dihydropteroate synthase [Robiginitalea sp. IMCC44478]|uniref:dihydropteroate synthase n=1 Tax=Robiginitalea sp. IMCC44478 TaxID=3459122 RepID=UPI004042F090
MTICCKGRLIDLSIPKIMGILNCTPDSFYDGGQYTIPDLAFRQAETLLEEGVDFIDIGGYSSRPGALDISESEEADRVLPVIEKLVKIRPEVLISIDTFRSQVARQALEAGAAMVNDISGGLRDPGMLPLIADKNIPYILMHMKGTPQNMARQTEYDNLLIDLRYYFSERLSEARALGITDCIIDPGFGFAKTREQNFVLLRELRAFEILEVPILAGISRKSMIYKTLDITAGQALNGTTALHMIALQNGANILRVHDVKEAVQCVRLHQQLHAG